MKPVLIAAAALLLSACSHSGMEGMAAGSADSSRRQLAGANTQGSPSDDGDNIKDAFFKRRDYHATIRIATEVLANTPAHDGKLRCAYLTLRGAANFHLNRDRAALDDLDAATKADRCLALTYEYLGRIADRQKRHDYAVNAYTVAIEISPEAVSSYYYRGISRALMGNLSGGIADIGVVIERRPDNAVALALRGLMYEAIGRPGAALADYRRALAIDPDNEYARSGMARLAQGNRPSQPPAIRRAPDNDEPPVVQF